MTSIAAPVIFLPGTQCDERVWLPVWRLLNLAQQSYVPLQWADSLQQMLALTQDRIDSYDEKVHLVGYSMGGYIASLKAIENQSKIASLTLIGYNPAGLSASETAQRKALLKTLTAHPLAKPNPARLAQFLTAKELTQSCVIDTITQMENDLGPSVLRAHISATTPRTDMRKPLVQSTLKVNLICAQQDKIADSSEIEEFAQQLSKVSYTCLNDAAHMMLLTQPSKVAEMLTEQITSNQ